MAATLMHCCNTRYTDQLPVMFSGTELGYNTLTAALLSGWKHLSFQSRKLR